VGLLGFAHAFVVGIAVIVGLGACLLLLWGMLRHHME
jgi:hypothetical protein